MLIGYMRVSIDSDRQVLDLQRDALLSAGVDERHLFEDRASGSRGDRAGLAKALAFIKPGDCLVVWKLDRLGRSLPHLLATVTALIRSPCGEAPTAMFLTRRRCARSMTARVLSPPFVTNARVPGLSVMTCAGMRPTSMSAIGSRGTDVAARTRSRPRPAMLGAMLWS